MSENIIMSIIAVGGTIVGAVIGFVGNVFIEKRKAKNDSRIYITKTQFEYTYEVFKKLSKAVYDYMVILSAFKEGYRLAEQKNDKQTYIDLVNACADIQDIVSENAPFIPKNLYETISELESETRDRFWKQFDSITSKDGNPVQISKDEYKRMEEIVQKTNDEIRTYLSRLAIVD